MSAHAIEARGLGKRYRIGPPSVRHDSLRDLLANAVTAPARNLRALRRLTRFGDDIKGIWAANDDMAVGTLEALRAEKLAGKVPVTGIDGIKTAIEAVRAGEFAATVSWDPYWQGSMGLAIAYAAKTGKIDPAKEPKEHREFYGTGVLVTKENADEFYQSHIASEPPIDFGRADGFQCLAGIGHATLQRGKVVGRLGHVG